MMENGRGFPDIVFYINIKQEIPLCIMLELMWRKINMIAVL